MLIRRVELQLLAVPFRAPVVAAGRTWTERRLALVRLAGDDDLEGVGEIALDGDPVAVAAGAEPGPGAQPGPGAEPAPADAPALLAEALAEALRGALVGVDVVDAAGTARRLSVLVRTIGRDLPVSFGRTVGSGQTGGSAWTAGFGRAVRAGAEAAVLDFRGRTLGRPVRDLLGAGGRAEVAVNGLVTAAAPDAAAREAAALVATGYRSLKVKVGHERTLHGLVERVAAVRSAVGPDVQLRLDANGAWSEAQAIRSARALGHVEPEYLEQPIAPRLGSAALARVRRESPVAIAADESVTGPVAAARLVRAGAVDVLIVKPARVGGPDVALEIAADAVAHGVGVVVSTMFETGIGLAGALHAAAVLPGPGRAHGLGTANLLVSDLLAGGPHVAHGRLAVPSAPGLGVVLDEPAIERFSFGVTR